MGIYVGMYMSSCGDHGRLHRSCSLDVRQAMGKGLLHSKTEE